MRIPPSGLGASTELDPLVREIERRRAGLDALCHAVSHDLRAPLRAIDGFGRALEEDCGDRLDDAGRAHLRRVRSAATRMSGMLDGLLQLLDAARTEIRPVATDLSGVFRQVAGELARREPARSVRVVVGDGLTVRVDPDLARIVARNLLDNAFKFTCRQTDARIELGATDRGGSVAFFVTDNGVGFEPNASGRLFRPFHRLHTEDFPGVGIGLAIVREIVERHGGSVAAEGRPGAGASFFFTLPRDAGVDASLPP
jgi:light-regulated signal transduction histidine kinase (bacteriophytochrome)